MKKARSCWEVLRDGAAASFMLDDRGARLVEGSFEQAKSALDIFVKDMGLVTDAARQSTYPAPLASAAEQLYVAGRRAGLGRRDNSSIIEVLRGEMCDPGPCVNHDRPRLERRLVLRGHRRDRRRTPARGALPTTTHVRPSLSMRSKSGTLRVIDARHHTATSNLIGPDRLAEDPSALIQPAATNVTPTRGGEDGGRRHSPAPPPRPPSRP